MEQEFFSVLHNEHIRLAQMLYKIGQTPFDLKQRDGLFSTFRLNMIPHMRAEEKTLYAGLLETPGTKEDGNEGLDEHHEIETIVKQLVGIPGRSPVWMSRLKDLEEKINCHIEKEETVFFIDAGRVISAQKLKDMLSDYRQEEDRVKDVLAAEIRI